MLFIDLHGLNVQQAKKAITNLFHKALEQNVESIYIITGRGNHVNANGSSGVLKKLLPSLLKPYADKIECMDTEGGAYKIFLKQEPSVRKKLVEQLAKTELFDLFQTELEQEVKNGSSEAMITLACLYLSFFSTDENKVKSALKMLYQLEQKNNATAGIVLSEVYLDGICTKREPEKGFKLLKKYATHSKVAKFNLAKCYLLGEGIKRDDAMGLKLMKQLADENDGPACGNLGKSYLSGDFTEVNHSLGVEYLQKAADQEYSLIYVDLARCYGSGQGVAQDDRMALRYYKKAAQLNNPYAIHQIGDFHLNGRAVVADAKKAFSYFLQAANLGDVDSEAIVGILYFKGQGVTQNFPDGIKWLTKAADKNNVYACFILGEILLSGVVAGQDIPLAKKYLRVAIKDDYPYAMFSLALAILKLPHSTQEKDEAFNLLKMAHGLKNIETQYIALPSWAGLHFMLAWTFFNPPKDMIAKTAKKDLFFLSLTMVSTGFMQEKMYDPTLALEITQYAADQGDVESQLYLLTLFTKVRQTSNTPAIPQSQQNDIKTEEEASQNTRKPYFNNYTLATIGIVATAVASAALYQFRK